ncbi:MAG: hypothetical protein WDN00_13495 [Limisphaerales bacterium]
MVALKLGWANNSDTSQSSPPGAWVAWNNVVLQDAAHYPPPPSFTKITPQPEAVFC